MKDPLDGFAVTMAGSAQGPGGILVFALFLACGLALSLDIAATTVPGIALAGVLIHLAVSLPVQTWWRLFFLTLWRSPPDPETLIETLTDYANIARKDGILKLEEHPSTFPPLQSAKNNCVDGADPDFLESIIKQDARTVLGAIRRLRRTTGFMSATVGVWLVASGLFQNPPHEPAMATHGPWLALLALFALWNHWRLEVLENRLAVVYRLIRIGIHGVQIGVNPRMLAELLRSGREFRWLREEPSSYPYQEEPQVTREEVLADLDRYFTKRPPLVLTDPPGIPAKGANGEPDTFRFADITLMDDRSIGILLQEIPNETLLTALQGASSEAARLLMGNIGPRAGRMLVEDLERMGAPKKEKVREAQQEILNLLLRMESEGGLVIMGRSIMTFPGWESWEACRGYLIKNLRLGQMEVLDKAYRFAEQWHGDQKRPAGEPYTLHLLQVVEILFENDERLWQTDMLVSGLLHDVVEDTDCTLEEVRAQFGEGVAQLVEWLTKPERTEGESKDAAKKRYLERLRQAPEEAIIVKLADRVSNVQFLETHPRPEFQRKYFHETVENILPLAEEHPWFRGWFRLWKKHQEWRWADDPVERK